MFQGHKDYENVKDANSAFELVMSTALGDREDQQDAFGYELKPGEGLVVVCDGMGGHNGGKLASNVAVKKILEAYTNAYPFSDVVSFLQDATLESNKSVCSLTDKNGNPLKGGSTIVALVIKNKELFWSSVGDSRAYLFRDGQLVQFTLDHNYGTVLKEQLNAGIIDSDKFEVENQKSEALISFLGMNELKLIDYNDSSIKLQSNDKIIIVSDGLYKLVSDREIERLIDNFSNIEEALKAFEIKAGRIASQKKISRDNMTVALIKIK